MFKVTHIVHVNISCSDIEKSIEFYVDALGGIMDRPREVALGQIRPISKDVAEEKAKSWGFSEPSQYKACFIRFGDRYDEYSPVIDLLQKIHPPPVGEAIKQQDHIGITRICLHVDNADEAYKELESRGVEFFAPVHDSYTFDDQPPMRAFSCHGPDGEIITIVQHRPGYRSPFQEKLEENGLTPLVY